MMTDKKHNLVNYLEDLREVYFHQLCVLSKTNTQKIRKKQIYGGEEDGKVVYNKEDVDNLPSEMLDKLSRIDLLENILADIGVEKWVQLRESFPESEVE